MTEPIEPLANRLIYKMNEEINWRTETLADARNKLVDEPSDEARNRLILEAAVLIALHEVRHEMQSMILKEPPCSPTSP